MKLELQNKISDFKWDLVVVYGVAQSEYKEKFLTKLANELHKQKKPLIDGGIPISLERRVKKIRLEVIVNGALYLMQSYNKPI